MDDARAGVDWTPRDEPPQPAAAAARGSKSASSSYGWSAPTGKPTVALLLRHGETPLSGEKRFSGSGDPELNERGLAQAEAAAKRLTGWDVAAVVSSPRRRARQTAAAAATVFGLEVTIDDDLRETDFGAWEGMTFAEIRAQWPDEMAAWIGSPDVAPPDGESFTATFTRVRTARDRLRADHPDRTIVVVSHVTPIKSLLRDALQAPPQALYRIHLDTASLSCVDWYDEPSSSVVRLVNDTSHLPTELMTGRG
jgi:probable phosphoglycerate mutase